MEVMTKRTQDESMRLKESRYISFSRYGEIQYFDSKNYLLDKPKYILQKLMWKHKIPGARRLSDWSMVSALIQAPGISETIYELIEKDKKRFGLSDGDLKKIKRII